MLCEKYEKLLNMLMDFNDAIRFVAICDREGTSLWHSKRTNVKNIIPLEDTKNFEKSHQCLVRTY